MGARTRPRSGVIFPNTALRLNTRAPSAAEASLAAKKQKEQAGADHQKHDAMVNVVGSRRGATPTASAVIPRNPRLTAVKAKICQANPTERFAIGRPGFFGS
jgi:hypothetical protein